MSAQAQTSKWDRSEADAKARARGCRFDERAGVHVVNFFEKFLRHSKGQWAGQPFTLQPWQRDDLIMPLFGWKRADGTRRFRVAYVEIPKKNGKSALCSGISLYLLVADNEPGAEVYCAAASRDQAGIVFNESLNMREASPALKARLEPVPSKKRLVFPAGRSFYQALAAESGTNEGLNIHGLIFDELHAQPNRSLWDALRYGGRARRQPLIVSITTAGYDRHSICYEQRDYALKVRDGILEDDAFFPLVYAADEKDDWTKPATWAKANPSLGVTLNEDTLAQECKEAQESPTKENAFKRYSLNIWTEQDMRWLQMDKWDACATPVNAETLAGRECYAGLDLATTTDVAALVLVFPDGPGYQVLPFFWVPGDNAQVRERRDRVPYVTWAKQGLVEMTEGNVIDYDTIRRRIGELGEKYNIKSIAIDRWNATQLAVQLEGDGFHVEMFGQGFASMSAPTKELEKLVIAGKIAHGGNPVLRWMASNVAVEQDAAGNLKPSKKKSTERIDGIVAAVMGLNFAMTKTDDTSVYQQRGFMTV